MLVKYKLMMKCNKLVVKKRSAGVKKEKLS